MNSKALSGVLMVGAAAAIAWAWLTGRLDKTIAQVTAQAQGKAVHPAGTGASGGSRLQ
jgi:hypothetical protein